MTPGCLKRLLANYRGSSWSKLYRANIKSNLAFLITHYTISAQPILFYGSQNTPIRLAHYQIAVPTRPPFPPSLETQFAPCTPSCNPSLSFSITTPRTVPLPATPSLLLPHWFWLGKFRTPEIVGKIPFEGLYLLDTVKARLWGSSEE